MHISLLSLVYRCMVLHVCSFVIMYKEVMEFFFGVLMLFLQCVLTSLVMVEWLQHADTHYLTLPQFSGSVTE